MSLVVVFVWRKSPRLSISTFMFDNKTMDIISTPKIIYFSYTFLSFKRQISTTINTFFNELSELSDVYKSIKVEYKIVFRHSMFSWVKPSTESKIVYKYFMKTVKRFNDNYKNIKIERQLRRKLKGKSLKHFKRELRKMDLVSRKKDTNYEYLLWMVGLHATSNTYEKKLLMIKNILMEKFWAGV